VKVVTKEKPSRRKQQERRGKRKKKKKDSCEGSGVTSRSWVQASTLGTFWDCHAFVIFHSPWKIYFSHP